jgi:hypothetical protein
MNILRIIIPKITSMFRDSLEMHMRHLLLQLILSAERMEIGLEEYSLIIIIISNKETTTATIWAMVLHPCSSNSLYPKEVQTSFIILLMGELKDPPVALCGGVEREPDLYIFAYRKSIDL